MRQSQKTQRPGPLSDSGGAWKDRLAFQRTEKVFERYLQPVLKESIACSSRGWQGVAPAAPAAWELKSLPPCPFACHR
jgi:hypothetical protein